MPPKSSAEVAAAASVWADTGMEVAPRGRMFAATITSARALVQVHVMTPLLG